MLTEKRFPDIMQINYQSISMNSMTLALRGGGDYGIRPKGLGNETRRVNSK